jgi:hypothetical protein
MPKVLSAAIDEVGQFSHQKLKFRPHLAVIIPMVVVSHRFKPFCVTVQCHKFLAPTPLLTFFYLGLKQTSDRHNERAYQRSCVYGTRRYSYFCYSSRHSMRISQQAKRPIGLSLCLFVTLKFPNSIHRISPRAHFMRISVFIYSHNYTIIDYLSARSGSSILNAPTQLNLDLKSDDYFVCFFGRLLTPAPCL